MKRLLPIILPIAILLLLGFGGAAVLSSLSPKPEKVEEEPKGLSVFAERIIVDDLALSVSVQGEVRPRRQILVAPQIAGRVSYVSPDFVDGGAIRRGQMLVKLEAADYELIVVRAQSGVASAEQRLVREQAEAEIARQDLIDLGLTDASPLARREPQLAEARASLASARAQLRDAELGLERTAVYAPFTGRVREKNVDVGQFATPGQSLGSIFATDVVEVSLPITDAQLGQLGLPLAFNETKAKPGPDVMFSGVVGGQPRQWKGRITRTSAAVNSQTRLINVIGEVLDPYGKGADNGAPMAPGLFVDAKVDGATLNSVLVAPREALRGANEIYIGDRENGKISIRKVSPVYQDETGVYFADGVEAGELVIVSPIQGASDGMTVEVTERLPDGTLIPPPERKKKSDDAKDDDGNALVSGGADDEESTQ